MDPVKFIDLMYQFSAFLDFVKMLEAKYLVGGETGLPAEGRAVFESQREQGLSPRACGHPTLGLVVTAIWPQDEDDGTTVLDPTFRMVAWAACGPAVLNEYVCERWKRFGQDEGWRRRGGAALVPDAERWAGD